MRCRAGGIWLVGMWSSVRVDGTAGWIGAKPQLPGPRTCFFYLAVAEMSAVDLSGTEEAVEMSGGQRRSPEPPRLSAMY